MEVYQGEIIVCELGFKGGGGSTNDPSYGGAGYVAGKMIIAKENGSREIDVHWGFDTDGGNNFGVFNRAIRLATDEEIQAFNNGVRNIKDIQQTKTFKISYESIDGEFKKAEIDAFYETAAVSSIKDLKRLNYVMTL